MKIQIIWRGYEPILYIRTSKTSYTFLFFDWFRRLNKYIYKCKLRKRFKKDGYKLINCHGCNHCYSEWKIIGFNDICYVCKYCVGFYSKYEKLRLETLWRMETETQLK